MRYLIVDKKQRIETSSDSTYAQTRLAEELEKIGATYLFATTDDIEITLGKKISIKVLGEDIESFTHIILRSHRLHKLWEYETKKVIADYIDQYNKFNPDKSIKLQNIEAIKTIQYYDKLWIQKMCIENELPVIPTLYRTSGIYRESLKAPYIIKDFTGENDLRMIDGKEKVKKNVYLINQDSDLEQENLKNKDTSKYFVQDFIPTGQDHRIFVSNGEVVGGWTRKATEGFMTVKGGEYSQFDIENETEITEIALKTAKVLKADFIAVDFMVDESEGIYILEISLNPGFKAYETKVPGNTQNLASIIIQSFGI